jgi:hypothetical protein
MSFLDPNLAQSNGRGANTVLFQDLSLKEAFQLFDDALYRAKEEGRSRIIEAQV